MPLNSGLTAAFVTLLGEDVERPSFEVVESADKQTIIIKTAASNGEALLNRVKEVFRSHGHTAEHIPFQLQPIQFAQADGSLAVSTSASLPNSSHDLDKFPKVDFTLVELESLKGKEIFERLFSEGGTY